MAGCKWCIWCSVRLPEVLTEVWLALLGMPSRGSAGKLRGLQEGFLVEGTLLVEARQGRDV